MVVMVAPVSTIKGSVLISVPLKVAMFTGIKAIPERRSGIEFI
jgi:hypothetical protein